MTNKEKKDTFKIISEHSDSTNFSKSERELIAKMMIKHADMKSVEFLKDFCEAFMYPESDLHKDAERYIEEFISMKKEAAYKKGFNNGANAAATDILNSI